jgi:hypothetical protein
MPEGTTTETTPQTGGPGTNVGSEPGSAPAAGGGDQGKTFTQADLDRIVTERLAAEKARQEKALAKEREAAEQAKLAEQGQYRELAEREKARAAELEARLAQRERDILRRDVAARHNLPPALAARLQGDDEAAMAADAAELAKLLPAPGSGASPTNPASGRGATLTADDIRKMSPDEINARWDEVSRAVAGR